MTLTPRLSSCGVCQVGVNPSEMDHPPLRNQLQRIRSRRFLEEFECGMNGCLRYLYEVHLRASIDMNGILRLKRSVVQGETDWECNQ